MKSILLIDDNSKMQRQSYGASFVDDEVFENILHHIECVNKDFNLSILDEYGCVMIHDSLEDFINGSFDENSHVAKDLIVEYLDDHQIPYSQTVSYFCIGEKRIIIQYWSPVITDVIKCRL